MKRFVFFLVAVCMLFSMTAYAANGFTDIADHPAKDSIEKFAEHGYINGFPNGTFKPDNEITRAEFAAILSKFSQPVGIGYEGFADVQFEDWFNIYVEKSVTRGFLDGYPDGSFKPHGNVTRFEAIKVISQLVRFDGYVSVQLPYNDSDVLPLWVSNHVRNLYGMGVIGAYVDNKIDGNTAITRGEVVVMLCRVLEKYGWSQDELTAVTQNNVRNPLTIPTEMPHEIIGYLSIPPIGLANNPVRDGATLENMKISIAHYAETSIWDGNIGLCAHNQDYTYDFRNLHKVNIGDEVIYRTRFGERRYKITLKVEIADDDWSYLSKYSEINKITMTTCIKGVPSKRLCVQAEEI